MHSRVICSLLALAGLTLGPSAVLAIGIAGRAGNSSGGSNLRNRVADARGNAGNRASVTQPNRNTGANRNTGGGNDRGNLSRPNLSGGNASRPSISRPNTSTPSLGGIANRPGVNRPEINRPNLGANRPNVNLPNVSRPGGITTLPAVVENRPRPLPSVPDLGTIGGNRPNLGGNRPGVIENRPSLPNRPDLGNIGSNRPNLGGNRPSVENRPSLPNRPDLGNIVNRPDLNRDRPRIIENLPNRPDGSRPSLPDLGDFLGIQRPEQLPGIIDRPGNGNRPGIDRPNRPGTGDRPSIDRPNLGGGNRPDWNVRPERPILGGGNNNSNIHNRPPWVNIDNDRLGNVRNRWNTAITTRPAQLHDWRVRRPDRVARWRFWGNSVRFSWGRVHVGVFGPTWWTVHRPVIGGWHHWHNWQRYSWVHWWGRPVFVDVSGWFRWRAPAVVWKQPIFYDFGPGGNVVINDNRVFINGEDVGTAQELAQSAADLATVKPPDNEAEADEAEWKSLGTFAVSASEDEGEPTRLVQLAVNRDGIISGTWFNTLTDTAQAVLGQVDVDTQRVAFRIGEHDDVIVETGLYNLTLDEAPVLVHFGDQQREFFLLVRLDKPDDAD